MQHSSAGPTLIRGSPLPRISVRSGRGQAEPLLPGVDREDPDRDAGTGGPGLLRRETGAAIGFDKRTERHLLGHNALDDVTDLVTGEEILAAHGYHLPPLRVAVRAPRNGGGPLARAVIKQWPGIRSVHGARPSRQSQPEW